MPYVVRPYHRVSIVSPVTYEHWTQQGQGMAWNLSRTL